MVESRCQIVAASVYKPSCCGLIAMTACWLLSDRHQHHVQALMPAAARGRQAKVESYLCAAVTSAACLLCIVDKRCADIHSLFYNIRSEESKEGDWSLLTYFVLYCILSRVVSWCPSCPSAACAMFSVLLCVWRSCVVLCSVCGGAARGWSDSSYLKLAVCPAC